MSYEIIKQPIHLGNAMQIHVIAENLDWLRDAELDLMKRYEGKSASTTIKNSWLVTQELGRMVGIQVDNPSPIEWVTAGKVIRIDNIEYKSAGTPINAIIVIQKG